MRGDILVVDDDPLLRRSLAINLEHAGYEVQTAESGEAALALVKRRHPDLILLDVGLPDADGLEVLVELRKTTSIPVIFLTARRRKLDEVLGLELGAEDYITKPFDTDVLLARVNAVLRRTLPSALTIGDLTIDPTTRMVSVSGHSLTLPPREFDLLYVLASRAGKVVPVEDLLARAWGAGYEGESQVVYVRIRALREVLEADPNRPRRLLTVRGVGYKLVPQEP